MPNYEEMNKELFNVFTGIINMRQEAQQEAEEMYIRRKRTTDPELW